MANHTPEPWAITEFGNVSTHGNEGINVVAVSGFGNLHPEPGGCANTRRIVTCVNACAGIPDDLLQDDDKNIINRYTQHLRNETVRQADLLVTVTAQRDELIDELDTTKKALAMAVNTGPDSLLELAKKDIGYYMTEAVKTVIAQRDELITSLNDLIGAIQFTPLGVTALTAITRARATIAKCEVKNG